MRRAKARCMRPTCKRFAVCRGLCRSDYTALHLRVSSGAFSWDAAVKHGLCLPVLFEIQEWMSVVPVAGESDTKEQTVLVSVTDRERKLLEQMRAIGIEV